MKNQWISVKDRLPEENVSVMVFIPEEDNHITAGMWDVSKKWVLLDEYRIPKSQVTYWASMIAEPEDKSYEPSEYRPDEMDTITYQMRELQRGNFKAEARIKELEEALTKISTHTRDQGTYEIANKALSPEIK